MTTENSFVPFDLNPALKLRTVDVNEWKPRPHLDEVMPDLLEALTPLTDLGQLRRHQGSKADQAKVPGTLSWFMKIGDEYKSQNMHFPPRNKLKDYGLCNPTAECPYGISKACGKDSNGQDTFKPLLTVEKMIRLATTKPEYTMLLSNNQALHNELRKNFSVPPLKVLEFLRTGATHKKQIYNIVNGKLIRKRDAPDHDEDDEDDDVEEGQIVAPAIPPERMDFLLNRGLEVINEGMAQNRDIIQSNNTIANNAILSNEKVRVDIKAQNQDIIQNIKDQNQDIIQSNNNIANNAILSNEKVRVDNEKYLGLARSVITMMSPGMKLPPIAESQTASLPAITTGRRQLFLPTSSTTSSNSDDDRKQPAVSTPPSQKRRATAKRSAATPPSQKRRAATKRSAATPPSQKRRTATKMSASTPPPQKKSTKAVRPDPDDTPRRRSKRLREAEPNASPLTPRTQLERELD